MQTFWIIVSALAFNAAALALMFFYFRRLIRRALGLDEVLDRAREEIGGMIAEMNQTTDRNVSLIEDRIAKAQALVETAEKRFELLGRQAGQQSREREMFARLSRAAKALPVAEGQNAAESRGATENRNAELRKRESAEAPPQARHEGSGGRPEKGGEASAGTPRSDEPSREEALPRIEKRTESVDTGLSPAERAIRLWEQGFSPGLIAPKLGMTIAEIDLIISMEEQRRLLGR